MTIRTRIISSMEKCFLDESINSKPVVARLSALKNERLSFQLAYTGDRSDLTPKHECSLTIEGDFADKLKIFKVEQVPVLMPVYRNSCDENYLRTEAGLFPDLLVPFDIRLPLNVVPCQLKTLLVTVCDEEGLPAGDHTLKFVVSHGEDKSESEITVHVVDASLPEQTLIHTQWFHNDCLATYYDCPVFSERHWTLIGNYMDAAVKCGVNMILTPVLTPPLDTAVGTERPTVQLVDITLRGGEYEFGYSKLDRYLSLALEKGMKYFEISHFFSQWGAIHAPKVMATVFADDGSSEYRRIFGWETDAAGEDYKKFIRAFVSSLVAHLKKNGLDKMCWFHISDEPNISQLESYKAAKAIVSDLLAGYPVMDALSSYEFYSTGAVDIPVPASNHITPFLEGHVKDLWTYYCCSQNRDVSNRFIAMPGARTRILGEQFYKYDIKGFLQWGFNFWYSQGSLHPVNPFADPSCDYFAPAGDEMSVYPGQDGKALYSLHAVLFYEALQDMRALQLLEKKLGREAVTALIDLKCGEPMTFFKYPRSEEYILLLREKVNSLL